MTNELMIPPSMVDAAEAAGACEEAIEWLRARPRSWRDLALNQPEWFLWVSDDIGCPPDVLAALALDDDARVRRSVAFHQLTMPDVLGLLAQDDDPDVRQGAASNPSTPPDALAVLASNPFWRTRIAVSMHPHAPADALAVLAKDVHEHVRWIASRRLQRASVEGPS